MACAMFLVLSCATWSHADIFFVDAKANPEFDDGESWGTAFLVLEDALIKARTDQIGAPHEIRVAGAEVGGGSLGEVYLPGVNGNGPRTSSFEIDSFLNRLKLKGGYIGANNPNFPDSNDFIRRDASRFVTILSGDLNDDDTGFWGDPSRDDNCEHVLIVDNADSSDTQIDGFKIMGGRSRLTDFRGGGMWIKGSNVTVTNCWFEDNSAGRDIGEFSALSYGGGVAIQGVSPFPFSTGLRRVSFQNCVFVANTAGRGGGIALVGDAIPPDPDPRDDPQLVVQLVNCVVGRNVATKLANELSDGAGAAIYMREYAILRMHHCTVADNSSFVHSSLDSLLSGGLVLDCVSDVELMDEGFMTQWTGAQVFGSIFWNNRGFKPGVNDDVRQIVRSVDPCSLGNFPLVVNCDVEGGFQEGVFDPASTPIIDVAPAFEVLAFDYRLTNDSVNDPLRDIGDPAHLPSDKFDVDEDGNTIEPVPDPDFHRRDGDDGADLGAYELFDRCCADVSGENNNVGIEDFLLVLAQWGCMGACSADACEDGEVGIDDFLMILADWGPCGEPVVTCACNLLPASEKTQTFESVQFAGLYGPVSDIWDQIAGGGPWPLPRTLTTRYRLVADEFIPVNSESIGQIHWWGFYDDEGADCESGYTDQFTVTYYYTDCHPVTLEEVPGAVMASYSISAASMTEVETLPGGIKMYFYHANHAPLAVTAGLTYWIEISNNGGSTLGATGCHWHWAWSDSGTSAYSAQNLEDDEDYLDAADPANPIDLSFGLNIEFSRMTDPDCFE